MSQDGQKDDTQKQIDRILARTGWDSFALLIQICMWLEETGQSQALLDHLTVLAEKADDPDRQE
jgi:hypothetical protein